VRHLPLAVLLIFSAALARADEWEHSYPVTGKPEIVIAANAGDVEVAMASSQEVAVRVIAHGWKINDDLKITGTQSGNRVEIRLHRSDKACFGFCFASIKVEVRVPRESDLDLDSEDGNLRVDDVRGNFQLQTNDGDIRIRGAAGRLHANTHDGNIDVEGRFEMLNLRSGDGNIDAQVSAAQTPEPGWALRTGDGNIRLTLPDNFAADIEAHTGDGSVKVDFPMTSSGTNRESEVRGKIKGGGISIQLQTGDGDVRVEKG
jgi:Putative adhesin